MAGQSTIEEAINKDRASSEPYLRKAQEVVDRQFSFGRIALDYFFPAVFAAFAGLIPAYVLVHPTLMEQYFDTEIATGVLLGTFGAYVYVLMMPGDRTFQRDITTGIATWSGVQLILGPVLGGVIAGVLLAGTQLTDFSRHPAREEALPGI